MTPQKKAKELVDKYKIINMQYVLNGMANEGDINDEAKECALIAANEIESMMYVGGNNETFTKKYWQEVKEKINNLI